jgi:hypothetical protein
MRLVVGAERVSAFAVNVSVGGAAVRTNARASVGEIVELEVEHFGSRRFTLRAEVVRAERGALALRFLALHQRALEALLGLSDIAAAQEDDPSGVRHVGSDLAPGSRREG